MSPGAPIGRGTVGNHRSSAKSSRAPTWLAGGIYDGVVYTDDDGEPVIATEPILSEAKWHRLEKVATQRHSGGIKKGGGRSFVSLLGGLLSSLHMLGNWFGAPSNNCY